MEIANVFLSVVGGFTCLAFVVYLGYACVEYITNKMKNTTANDECCSLEYRFDDLQSEIDTLSCTVEDLRSEVNYLLNGLEVLEADVNDRLAKKVTKKSR